MSVFTPTFTVSTANSIIKKCYDDISTIPILLQFSSFYHDINGHKNLHLNTVKGLLCIRFKELAMKNTNNREKNNKLTDVSHSKLIVKSQAIAKRNAKVLWTTIRFTTTLLFFLNQLMSYSIAIEIDQGNIRRIELNQKSNKLIEKISSFIFGENDENGEDDMGN